MSAKISDIYTNSSTLKLIQQNLLILTAILIGIIINLSTMIKVKKNIISIYILKKLDYITITIPQHLINQLHQLKIQVQPNN